MLRLPLCMYGSTMHRLKCVHEFTAFFSEDKRCVMMNPINLVYMLYSIAKVLENLEFRFKNDGFDFYIFLLLWF